MINNCNVIVIVNISILSNNKDIKVYLWVLYVLSLYLTVVEILIYSKVVCNKQSCYSEQKSFFSFSANTWVKRSRRDSKDFHEINPKNMSLLSPPYLECASLLFG